MSSTIFIFLLFLAAITRPALSILLIVLKNFSKPLRGRIDFERQNLIQPQCRSFKLDNLFADYCFEVSSEGELEQVRPLIDFYLSKNKRIEILFSSPSVETKLLKWSLENINHLRVMRLPLVSYFPINFLFFQSVWSFETAPIIIFCRYDFFPELLSFKFLNKKLILLSAANKKPSWFKNQSYHFFSLIVASNKTEGQYFKEHFKSIKVFDFDFRVPRIFKRLELASKTLNSAPALSKYLSYLDSRSSKEKFILGSAWGSDLLIFQNDLSSWTQDILSGTKHLLIVPHDLKVESIYNLKISIKSFFPNIPIYEINDGLGFDASVLKVSPGIVIVNLSGILCELYSKFSFAYVGGGYERSIHSVLEPFLSGCQVACGPKVSRSTEYDYILDLAPDEIHLLNNTKSFYTVTKSFSESALEISNRHELLLTSNVLMESIINEIESC